MIKLQVVHAANDNCHKLGAAVLRRAVRFCQREGQVGNPEYLWHYLAGSMAQNPANVMILAGIENKKLVGHVIAEFQNHHGIPVIMITQWEMDKGVHHMQKAKAIRQGWEMISDWGKARKAEKVMCWAANDELAIMFSKIGFVSKDFVMMQQDLPEEKDEES